MNKTEKLICFVLAALLAGYIFMESGKRKDAAAIVNMARSSRAQAQTMIGSVQYDLFSGKAKPF